MSERLIEGLKFTERLLKAVIPALNVMILTLENENFDPVKTISKWMDLPQKEIECQKRGILFLGTMAKYCQKCLKERRQAHCEKMRKIKSQKKLSSHAAAANTIQEMKPDSTNQAQYATMPNIALREKCSTLARNLIKSRNGGENWMICDRHLKDPFFHDFKWVRTLSKNEMGTCENDLI